MADANNPYGTLYCPVHGDEATTEFKPKPMGEYKYGRCGVKAEHRRVSVPYPPEVGMPDFMGCMAINECGLPLFPKRELAEKYARWYREQNAPANVSSPGPAKK